MATEICVEELFAVPAHVLYEAFLDPHQMMRVGLGAPAEIDPKVGGRFSWFNKSIEGEITALTPNKEIQEKWRFAEWEPMVYSDVKMKFDAEESDTTRLTIEQSGIPLTDKFGNGNCDVRVREGWRQHILDRFEKVLGYPRQK
ncbi:activator of hsp90 atpase 1 family protein [Toxoplasma gondii RUB]|uniref:Activator of 90 kDa heat shock protein ATPase homolog 1 n=12 Tax=Toxoplasma gondii TaxID=5811 RepID=B9PP15_TOXGV|nr:activator of hsp90 atpase 1 family protein [Toxoplasma gondii GT1]ESS31640.1 activator of hsp90 atpase 1 family protein [Toxoplasma gondii VEG]KFG33147.1 activator of hsp90 atpase 1 family protein [Toxoplasma gondii GAB2-2007-GAL-DOM2]KFG34339.1 activator of hsp90 atpase 1 family protein [Toxoplasma gondii p89]KFG51489.1 activator of hsp90 atpase 1 family protein [Toxoplasma gondii FOU]KFG60279.1 activator of hsp90 atpase 1 family protein [Toxoplasma gondii RUB]KFH04712.1 activator of hsp9